MIFCSKWLNNLKIVMSRIAQTTITPSINRVDHSKRRISSREIFCHMARPHRLASAMTMLEMFAAVFLRIFSSEKIKIWSVVFVRKS